MTVKTEKKSLRSKPKNKGFKVVVILPVVLFLIVFGVARYRSYYRENVVAASGGDPVVIYVAPEDKAARASAQYLAYNIERTLGTKAQIVTERKETTFMVSILCGEELSEQSGQKVKKKLADAVVPANTDEYDVYSVALTNSGLTVLVPDTGKCFGAVKAVTDRWLQEDCGLSDSAFLRSAGLWLRKN